LPDAQEEVNTMPITRNSAVQGRTNAAGARMRTTARTQEVERSRMPKPRSGRDTVWSRAQSDARFRAAMLTEAINELLAGDLDTGKA